MNEKVKWGILSTGKIANKFAQDLLLVENAELVAVGSRGIERAAEFKEKYGAKYAFSSYEELVNCGEVDVIYIGTPHTMHMDNTLLCLRAGKNVLCEKPLGINGQQVQQMVIAAREQNLFLMEAIWSRFFPFAIEVKRMVDEGELGDLVLLEADFGFPAPFNPDHRLFSPALAGGALLDVGIYPCFLALLLFGKPEHIHATAIKGKTGIDEVIAMQMRWPDGKVAQLHATIRASTKSTAHIYGTEKHISIPRRWHEAEQIFIVDNKGNRTERNFPKSFTGYKYEIEEVNDCILSGKTQSALLPLSFSQDLMAIMDEVRKQIGLVYPIEN